MNVLIVWDADYPWDIRVDKVGTTLVRAKHSVTVACRNLARRALYDEYNGTSINRLPVVPSWSPRINAALSFPAFFSPIWISHIYRAACRCSADLIVVRDLPMALAALAVARYLRVPIVLDMAECYPEMLRCIWKFEEFRFRNVFLRNPFFADVVERVAIRFVDEIWVMIEESRNRLVRKGVPKEKIRIVSNTPNIERFSGSEGKEVDGECKRTDREPSLSLVYVGLLNPSRGLDTVIQGVARFRAEGGMCELTIAGEGKARDRLMRLVQALGVEEQVRFLGWVDNSRVPELVRNADVGIVPHHRCTHWETTIPNKLFDYMAAGLPVIVSDVTPMMRIVNEVGCGRVYRDFDPDDLVRVMRELCDAEKRQSMGERGRVAVCGKYNWRNEEAVILRSVEALTNNWGAAISR